MMKDEINLLLPELLLVTVLIRVVESKVRHSTCRQYRNYLRVFSFLLFSALGLLLEIQQAGGDLSRVTLWWLGHIDSEYYSV